MARRRGRRRGRRAGRRPGETSGGRYPEEGKWLEADLVVWRAKQNHSCERCAAKLKKASSLTLVVHLPDRLSFTCLPCSDLDAAVFIPAGDAALTRRVSKHSPLRGVLVSGARRRLRRHGVFVSPDAVERACSELGRTPADVLGDPHIAAGCKRESKAARKAEKNRKTGPDATPRPEQAEGPDGGNAAPPHCPPHWMEGIAPNPRRKAHGVSPDDRVWRDA